MEKAKTVQDKDCENHTIEKMIFPDLGHMNFDPDRLVAKAGAAVDGSENFVPSKPCHMLF